MLIVYFFRINLFFILVYFSFKFIDTMRFKNIDQGQIERFINM